MEVNTNELVRICLVGLSELKAKDPFDYETFYPSDEGKLVQKEANGPIDDVTLRPELAAVLEATNNKEVYWWINLIIFRLLRNTKSPVVGEYVIDLIKKETKAWKIRKLTNSLSNGAFTDRVAELSYLLYHGNRHIVYNMLCAYRPCNVPSLEEPLIHVLTTSKYRCNLIHAACALGSVGTTKALDVLKPLLNFKKQDVKCAALLAITDILKEEGCDFYINLFLDKNWRDKLIATIWIRKYCGAKGVVPIAQRIKAILNRKRHNTIPLRIEGVTKPELVFNVEFISKYYSENDAVEHTYKLLEKKWDRVVDSEKEEIKKLIITSRALNE